MSVYSWLLKEHRFFRDLTAHLSTVIEERDVRNFDDLVVASRRPARTVLLALNELISGGVVAHGPAGIVPRAGTQGPRVELRRAGHGNENPRLAAVVGRYMELAAVREVPALLWGQRRLIPRSAVDRGRYVLDWMERRHGVVMFLGDDDLVSPLVAAGAPGWQVHVVDIDRGVLDSVERTAAALGAQVHIHHADLAKTVLAHEGSCDITVSDPFPSGDGSFEAVFWSHATRALRPGGLSITTVAPSHKPLAYANGALRRQQELGLSLLDLRADFGWYESFEFELTPLERNVLAANGLRSTVSQTKSIMAARSEPAGARATTPAFDFAKWSAATTDHYLTRQAGLEEQRAVARDRGAGNVVSDDEHPRRGMRVDLILPAELRTRIPVGAHDAASAANQWMELLMGAGADPSKDEAYEIVRLMESADLQPDGPLGRLGLAIRAIESWERWRLDI